MDTHHQLENMQKKGKSVFNKATVQGYLNALRNEDISKKNQKGRNIKRLLKDYKGEEIAKAEIKCNYKNSQIKNIIFK